VFVNSLLVRYGVSSLPSLPVLSPHDLDVYSCLSDSTVQLCGLIGLDVLLDYDSRPFHFLVPGLCEEASDMRLDFDDGVLLC
jgi:hypothetical protein